MSGQRLLSRLDCRRRLLTISRRDRVDYRGWQEPRRVARAASTSTQAQNHEARTQLRCRPANRPPSLEIALHENRRKCRTTRSRWKPPSAHQGRDDLRRPLANSRSAGLRNQKMELAAKPDRWAEAAVFRLNPVDSLD